MKSSIARDLLVALDRVGRHQPFFDPTVTAGRLLRAQDEERRRIARDLHDSSGQILVAVQLNLTPIEEEARKMNADFAKGIQQSLDLVEQLSKELRTVSYLLHPPLLDEAGLPSALRWYVEGFAERSKINVQLE